MHIMHIMYVFPWAQQARAPESHSLSSSYLSY